MTIHDGVHCVEDINKALADLRVTSALGQDTRDLYARAIAAGATVQQVEEAIS